MFSELRELVSVVPSAYKKMTYLYLSLYMNYYVLSIHHIKLESTPFAQNEIVPLSLRQVPLLFLGIRHLEIDQWQDLSQKHLGIIPSDYP